MVRYPTSSGQPQTLPSTVYTATNADVSHWVRVEFSVNFFHWRDFKPSEKNEYCLGGLHNGFHIVLVKGLEAWLGEGDGGYPSVSGRWQGTDGGTACHDVEDEVEGGE